VPSDEVIEAALLAAADSGARVAGQRRHWTDVLGERADRYGVAPSGPAQDAADRFVAAGAADLLELGAGQGRDSLFFARCGFRVSALDFAASGVAAIAEKAAVEGLGARLRASVHDCREPLPFADASFDACFSHMLYCMALTTTQLEALSREVLRVLRPGGLQVYTARTTADPDYGAGAAHGDDRYESGGFIVHFFSRALVERLSAGFEVLEVREFEEGDLPRRLFAVVQRKLPSARRI
jgi:SAM-dependent methyltransferase